MSDPTITHLITSTNNISVTFAPYDIPSAPGTVPLDTTVLWDLQNFINMFRVAATFLELEYLPEIINLTIIITLITFSIGAVAYIATGGRLRAGPGGGSAGAVRPLPRRGRQ